MAEGVPIADPGDIPRDLYVNREIGVVLYDRVQDVYIGNVMYMNATW